MEKKRGIPQIEDRREQAIQSLMGLVRDFRKQGEPFAHALNQALDTFSDFRLGTARQEMRRELGRRFGQRSDFRKGRETKPIKRSRDEWLIEEARQHWREIGMPEEYEVLD